MITFHWQIGKTWICPWVSSLTNTFMFFKHELIPVPSHYSWISFLIQIRTTECLLNSLPTTDPCSLVCDKVSLSFLVRLSIQEAAQGGRAPENLPFWVLEGISLGHDFQTQVVTGHSDREMIWLSVNRTPTRMSALGWEKLLLLFLLHKKKLSVLSRDLFPFFSAPQSLCGACSPFSCLLHFLTGMMAALPSLGCLPAHLSPHSPLFCWGFIPTFGTLSLLGILLPTFSVLFFHLPPETKQDPVGLLATEAFLPSSPAVSCL